MTPSWRPTVWAVPTWPAEQGNLIESVNSMSWKEYYKQHLMTAEEAVNHIKSGDRVVVAHACGEPSYLLDVMVSNAKAYKNVEIVHMVAMGKGEYCKPEYAENFRHNAFFVGGSTRDAIAEGRGDFTPSFFFEVPRQFSTTMPVDVAMVMVTPPDENGMCSLGVSVDYTQEAVKQAKTVIAQVNPQMPWTGPYSLVSVEDLDCIVEHEAPLIELAPPKIGDIEKAIGEHCASLIPDGATLQLGIGAIPDAVLLFLKNKKDLGIHSEMFSDGVVELAEAGVITNAKKTLHPGKFVVAFLMGTRRLYDFVDHNPDVELRPVDYVNNPFVIASKGGVSIMAMPSTVKGKISKIVPLLDEGAAVTTSRNDVDYIVTEYGVAALKGQTLRQRARNLIEIAHPDFRDALKEEYEKRFHQKY